MNKAQRYAEIYTQPTIMLAALVGIAWCMHDSIQEFSAAYSDAAAGVMQQQAYLLSGIWDLAFACAIGITATLLTVGIHHYKMGQRNGKR